MLRAARRVLRWGRVVRARWKGTVRTKPRSKGGEEGGTMRSVYSTAMKKRRDTAKAQGRGWCRSRPTPSPTDHAKKHGPLPPPPAGSAAAGCGVASCLVRVVVSVLALRLPAALGAAIGAEVGSRGLCMLCMQESESEVEKRDGESKGVIKEKSMFSFYLEFLYYYYVLLHYMYVRIFNISEESE